MKDAKAIDRLFEWMIEGAPGYNDGGSIIDYFCKEIVSAGIPVDLYRLFLFTIHPLIKGRRMQWKPDGSGTEILEADLGLLGRTEYKNNPLPHVMETKKSLRRRLVDPDCPNDYIIVDELRAEGFTDYLVQPVIYIDGDVHTMSWSTRHRDGFSEADIAALERLRAPLTRLVEGYILRLNAANIISTYVGRGAGGKVLGGKILRGDSEEITAIILFADLKSYTSLSNAKPPKIVLETLNSFFDALEAPIAENGGEILKFMGDGLLAIFPFADKDDATRAQIAGKALEAIRTAHRSLVEDGDKAEFRSALHIGKLYYGNMGASRRLDFTEIGPAVNLTARLLGAASDLECDDVVSEAFAEQIGGVAHKIGDVALKGFKAKQPVYAVA